MVQHPVHRHAGDGDVEPQRQRPAGNASVLVEALAPGAIEGGEHQGNNNHSQDRVRAEQRKVKAADETVPGETRDAVEVVVGEVAGEEKHRGRKCREHAGLVCPDVLASNEEEAAGEQDGARGIKRGINRGKIGDHVKPAAFSCQTVTLSRFCGRRVSAVL
jgi:hypothetical protein